MISFQNITYCIFFKFRIPYQKQLIAENNGQCEDNSLFNPVLSSIIAAQTSSHPKRKNTFKGKSNDFA